MAWPSLSLSLCISLSLSPSLPLSPSLLLSLRADAVPCVVGFMHVQEMPADLLNIANALKSIDGGRLGIKLCFAEEDTTRMGPPTQVRAPSKRVLLSSQSRMHFTPTLTNERQRPPTRTPRTCACVYASTPA
jgi:hypothetical protein